MKKGPAYPKQMGTFHPDERVERPDADVGEDRSDRAGVRDPSGRVRLVKLEGHRMDGDIALTRQIPVRSSSTCGYPRGASAR